MTQSMTEWVGSKHFPPPLSKWKQWFCPTFFWSQNHDLLFHICKGARILKPNFITSLVLIFSQRFSFTQISHHQRAPLFLKYKAPKYPLFCNYHFSGLKFSLPQRSLPAKERRTITPAYKLVLIIQCQNRKKYIYIHINIFVYTHIYTHTYK